MISKLRKIFHNEMTWGLTARILSLAGNFLLLPLVLHYLAKDVLALYYVFSSLVIITSIIDFGFSPALVTNFAHAYAGVAEISSSGIAAKRCRASNWPLIGKLYLVARRIYWHLSWVTGVVFYSVGSYYIYLIVNSTRISLCYAIGCWLIYATAAVINMYFMYLSTLLQGSGKVNLANKISIVVRLSGMLLSALTLLLGYDLIGISFAMLTSCIIERYLLYRYTFDAKHQFLKHLPKLAAAEFRCYFKLISHNSLKYGIGTIGGYLLTRGSILIVTFYLGLLLAANYIFTLQVVSILTTISGSLIGAYIPKLNNYAVQNPQKQVALFSFANLMSLSFYLIAAIVIIFWGDYLLNLIHSKTHFIVKGQLILLLLVYLLEVQHVNFATLISTGNEVPFVRAAIFSGLSVFIVSVLLLKFTSLGVLGLIVTQGMVQLAYNNWYWIYYACKKYKFNYLDLFQIGVRYAYRAFKY